MVKKIRLSLGTAIELGLEVGEKDSNFLTIFLMTYYEGKCKANCAFCPQARDSTAASDRLSRISWPEYTLDSVLEHWPSPGKFRRICIQTICYDKVVDDVVVIVRKLREISKLPISVAIHPLSADGMKKLESVGVSNIGIAVDASTPELFDEIKGKTRDSDYRWNTHLAAIKTALQIFGKGRVTTHLIIGLGETEKEAVEFIFQMAKMGVNVGLFAFTNIKGTALENKMQPDISVYRRIQVIRYLIEKGELKESQVAFNEQGHIIINIDSKRLQDILSSGLAFQVSGCKGCNRPFYNERPRGPMYNYPRLLRDDEILKALEESGLMG
ncbi:radical SAM protein [Candidatus Thorarchaeota archaeon]|nr:MAG: radical SAM protein [Candidatus Thorarchaeota archaeon]